MKHKKDSALQSIVQSMWVPDLYKNDQSHIIISGRQKMDIDQTTNILTYEEGLIVLGTKSGCIEIRGKELSVISYSEKSISICGEFLSISFK
ncbi:MAG: YabP/YqfC family sporulation protein [Clostridia bacterium]|nr:YabP/YqfC family sporulation protein [Clostridia bacterium]